MPPPIKQTPPSALDQAMYAQLEKDRLLKRDTALAMLAQFQLDVRVKALNWECCARNFGRAYTQGERIKMGKVCGIA